jgi:hypothetical protein
MTTRSSVNRWCCLVVAEDIETGVTRYVYCAPEEHVTVASLFDHLEASRGCVIKYAVRLPVPTEEELTNGDPYRVH